jgi:hypothetical protein
MLSYPVVPESLVTCVNRLRHITGFVTTLHRPEDSRPLFFSRFYHVRRVSLICEQLGRGHAGAGRRFDWEYLRFLVWCHDVYRWPFAHNLEPRGFPLSCAAVMENLTELAIGCAGHAGAGEDVRGIVSRRRDPLSPEAEICLLADMIAGFFEDCLMVVAGLKLHPSRLPADDLRLLGIIADTHFLNRAIRIAGLLTRDVAIDGVAMEFDAWFLDLASSFIVANYLDRPGALQSQMFERIRAQVKDHLLRQHIYPLNNEHVSKGSQIRRVLQPALHQIVNPNAMLEFDEASLIEALVRDFTLTREETYALIPDLDYVARERPEHRLM